MYCISVAWISPLNDSLKTARRKAKKPNGLYRTITGIEYREDIKKDSSA